MQQTMIFDPPFTALPAPPKTEAASGDTTALVIEITCAHLQRLRFIQAVCEECQIGQPSLLTVADAQFALCGQEGCFALLFERYQISLAQVRETLLWAEEAYGGTLLVEDIIQALVARLMEEQYLRRRQARGRDA